MPSPPHHRRHTAGLLLLSLHTASAFLAPPPHARPSRFVARQRRKTAAEDDPEAAARKKVSFDKEEERIAALKLQLEKQKGDQERQAELDAGRVFTPEVAGEGFARCVAMPTVLPPSEMSGGKWRMFFYGREGDAWNGGRPAFLPTGVSGMAESNDGLHWTPVAGPEDGGAILRPSSDAAAWDHVHVGVVDVVETAKTAEAAGGYEMLYLGASAEAVDLGGGPGGGPTGPLEGFRMRCGVATGSADGRTWSKLDSANPVLDVGAAGEWDSLFASWPRALPLEPANRGGPWLLTYHSLQPPNDEGVARWAAGACVSEGAGSGGSGGGDALLGGPWTKLGRVLEGGPAGSWDERGIGTRHVVHGDEEGELWMVYEGVDGKGRHRLGLASSTDGGKTWTKRPGAEEGGFMFGGREGEEGAWDSGNIGTPFLVRRPRGAKQAEFPGWFLYYVGTSTDAATGKTSYAIGCAELINPDEGLTGQWRRVASAC